MSTATAPSFRRLVWPLAIAETVVWATLYYVFPALLPVWEAELGWSKTELSLGFTAALLVSATLAPLAGRLIDRGRGRWIFTGGALLGAVLLVLLSRVTEPWQFIAVWIALGVALSSTLYEACFAVLTNALGTRAKRAITLVTLVAGFAGTLAFPSAHALTALVGWRATLLVFAAALVVVAVPLIWYGCREAERHTEAEPATASPRARDAMGVLTRPAFWLLAIAFTTITLDHAMVLSHLLPMLDDRGIHQEAAILAASMFGPMQVAGRLAMMAAERHVSTRGMALACYLAMALAAAAAFAAKSAPGLVVALVILQGAGIGVTSIVHPVLVAELLGRRNFGVIAGMLAAASTTSRALGPTVAALIWAAGGYDWVLLVAMLLCLAAALAVLLAWRMPPDQARASPD